MFKHKYFWNNMSLFYYDGDFIPIFYIKATV